MLSKIPFLNSLISHIKHTFLEFWLFTFIISMTSLSEYFYFSAFEMKFLIMVFSSQKKVKIQ